MGKEILGMKDPDSGLPYFLSLDCGDTHCLPVFAARLNPEVTLKQFNDIDLQHTLYESHWYVSGYTMGFEDFVQEKTVPFTSDAAKNSTMFRIVVKSNLTLNLAEDLVVHFREAVEYLMKNKYISYTKGKRNMRSLALGDKVDYGHSICQIKLRTNKNSSFLNNEEYFIVVEYFKVR